MANARLKLSRVNTRKRRRSDTESQEELTAEVLVPFSQLNSSNCMPQEPETMVSPAGEEVRLMLLDRKMALEQRVNELAVGKPLPRVDERGYDANGVRLKRTHRDFLLQEMEWMAADFMQERKWRHKTARILAGSAQNHLSKKLSRSAKQEKQDEDARRRVAARVGREIKKFWTKIDKIISFKVKLQSDELRKAAMDRQLKSLVTQTERYALALAEAFCEPMEVEEEQVEENVGRKLRDEHKQNDTEDTMTANNVEMEDADSDSDFDGGDGQEVEEDDETTMAEEEKRMPPAKGYHEELAELEEENALSLDALRAKYAIRRCAGSDGDEDMEEAQDEEDHHVIEEEETGKDETMAVGKRVIQSSVADSGGEDSDFAPEMEEEDDEDTIAEEERTRSRQDVDDEVTKLQEESELSIEELRARYGNASVEEEEEEEEDSGTEKQEDKDQDDDDEEYRPADTEDIVDDERTLQAAEDANEFTKEEVDEEVRLLQQEGELSIDDLRAQYKDMAMAMEEEEEKEEDEDMDQQGEVDEHQANAIEPHIVTETLEEVDVEVEQEDHDDDDHHKTTLASSSSSSSLMVPTTRSFPRSYLLTSRLTLREYQQTGVNWLLSLCEKRINGILADEMGLGKTIQTISLLAYLASHKGIWGPHLIIVPTSCLVNWEMELKRFCPALKVVTYFGSAKKRKELRNGWSKPNAFHVCITSYQLAVQDAASLKRKKWYYLILDEAHNIKNWKSLRWQTLLHFHSQRRLLLTGTPLQNNIMELWALMHFLMPHVFSSRNEFTFWFQNPLREMVEDAPGSGSSSAPGSAPGSNGTVLALEQEQQKEQELVAQLHGIIRPFVLRRLKKDVATQLPGKFEHVVVCKLSKRQKFLYEDFISQRSTKRALSGSGTNFMSMMNVLMQLRKVCNHPDLFEPRAIASPFDMTERLCVKMPNICVDLVDWLAAGTGRTEIREISWWPSALNLVNQELHGNQDKHTSKRIMALMMMATKGTSTGTGVTRTVTVDDLHCEPSMNKSRPDVMKRLLALAQARQSYWQEKRQAQEEWAQRVASLHEPMLGQDLLRACTMPVFISLAMEIHATRHTNKPHSEALCEMVQDPHDRIESLLPLITKAVCVVPKARARPLLVDSLVSKPISSDADSGRLSQRHKLASYVVNQLEPVAKRCLNVFYESFKRTQLVFPDKRLIQFDCGKLQQLDLLLRKLKNGNHRCLIFTQMASMLNILEIFLNLHGHSYFRLDGATKIDKRQFLMDKFNRDDKIFCFILSTRSGGLGINLTGADSVIFYDSDWNPAMDAQAQDRAHRIGQTREVNIYRLVSEHTVEENILKKAQQKRHLDFLVMGKGQFSTDFFSKTSLRELMGEDVLSQANAAAEEKEDAQEEEGDEEEEEVSLDAIEKVMAQLEDEEDVVAMRGATKEFEEEQREFDEDVTSGGGGGEGGVDKRRLSTASTRTNGDDGMGGDAEEEEDRDPLGEEEKTPSVVLTAEPPSATASVAGDEEEGDLEDDQQKKKVQLNKTSAVENATTSLAENESACASVEEEDGEEEEEEIQEDAGSNESEEGEDEDEDDDEEDSDDSSTVHRRRRGRAPPRAKANKKSKSLPSSTKPESSCSSSSTTALQQARATEKAREKEDERQLQAWKDSVSSLQHFEDSLNPVDRYALHFREDIDPLYAYVPTAEAFARHADQEELKLVNQMDEIEQNKMMEEFQWITNGELISSATTTLDEFSLDQLDCDFQLYKKERARIQSKRRFDLISGANWQIQKCAITGHPFYFNTETKEAQWEKPKMWIQNEQFQIAQETGFAGLPVRVLVAIFAALDAFPDRFTCELVCRKWHDALQHPALCVRVNASDFNSAGLSSSKRIWTELLDKTRRGETLLFGSGVYELDGPVEITKPIKLLAARDSHVELQMVSPDAQLTWRAKGGLLCGFHVSRRHHSLDKMSSSTARSSDPDDPADQIQKQTTTQNWQHLVHVTNGGCLRALFNDFDGNHLGNACLAISGNPSSTLFLQENRIFHAGSGSGVVLLQGGLVMRRNSVFQNAHSGITIFGGNAVLRRNHIYGNSRFGIRLLYHANNIVVEENKLFGHFCGNLDVENSGRRFVVRWNEMSGDDGGDGGGGRDGRGGAVEGCSSLPHDHGKVKIWTSRVEERVVQVTATAASDSKPKRPVKQPSVVMSSSTPGGSTKSAVVPAPVAVVAQPSASASAGPVTAFASVGPTRLPPQVAATAAAAAVLSVAQRVVGTPPPPPVNASPVPVRGQVVQQAVPTSQVAVAAVGSAVPPVARQPAAPVADKQEVGVAAPVAGVLPVASQPPATAPAAPAGPVAAPGAVLPTAAAAVAPAKAKATRKRKPKTEKVLVHKVPLLLHDTCEPKIDKKLLVKKRRRISSATTNVVIPATTSAAANEQLPLVGPAAATASSVPASLEKPREPAESSEPRGPIVEVVIKPNAGLCAARPELQLLPLPATAVTAVAVGPPAQQHGLSG